MAFREHQALEFGDKTGLNVHTRLLGDALVYGRHHTDIDRVTDKC
jgi:hypothetical protein